MGMGNAGHGRSVMLCLLIFLYFISHLLSPFVGVVGMVVVMFLDPFGGRFSFGGHFSLLPFPFRDLLDAFGASNAMNVYVQCNPL